MKTEPVITAGVIGAAAAATLTVLVAFGVPLTKDQTTAVTGLIAVLAPIAVALIARGQVTPNTAVVERQLGNRVIAGPANEAIPTGQTIRAAGSLSDPYEPQRAAEPVYDPTTGEPV